MSEKQILITGSNSGLGRYLCDHFPDAEKLNRDNGNSILSSNNKYDYIIHCAVDKGNSQSCMVQNVDLTTRLCSLAKTKLIFMSSIDVYRKENSFYIDAKKRCEDIVQTANKNNLSIRLCAMLGKYIQKNSIQRILLGETDSVTLDLDSSFYYCNHSHVLEFIKIAMHENISGIIDFVPASKTHLYDFYTEPVKSNEGRYKYESPDVDNSALSKYMPDFASRSSESIVREFAKKYC
tara:strand:+ start:28 stop:735 length:708 start_codon:yes stop_codon:yes gene_type:complete